MRKKILAILLALSLVLNVLFLVFALVQKAAADEARLHANESQLEANDQAMRAEINEKKVRQAQLEAERQAQLVVICNEERAKTRK
jgi:regulatory protein YycI of two-component signal transduction system YycFG